MAESTEDGIIKGIDPDMNAFLSSRIRDLISLIFCVAFVLVCYKAMMLESINKEVFNVFVNAVMLVLGYYFGNRGK